jgi:hypothetical protein
MYSPDILQIPAPAAVHTGLEMTAIVEIAIAAALLVVVLIAVVVVASQFTKKAKRTSSHDMNDALSHLQMLELSSRIFGNRFVADPANNHRDAKMIEYSSRLPPRFEPQ